MIKKIDRHIVLIGMMASGKSTIGKNMSEALGTFFYDIDYLIEKSENKTITEIFKIKGEEYFRKIEYEKTREIINIHTPSIISLGGGAFINPSIRNIMNDAHTIWLKLEISEIIKRVKLNNKRPLLSGKSEEEIFKILEEYSNNSVSFYEFINDINNDFSKSNKISLIQFLYKVAYADERLDVDEERLIRRIADLIHIKDIDVLKIKHVEKIKNDKNY